MKRIIIIGSGIGGLTAGNLLAQKGQDVTIFESHSSPGGYIAGFKRNGYYFESGTLAFEASAQIFQVMKEIGVYEKIKFFKKAFPRFVSDKFDAVVTCSRDIRQMLLGAYPPEAGSINAFYDRVDGMYGEMKKIMSLPNPIFLKGLKKIGGILNFLIKGGKFIKLAKQLATCTIPEFAEQYFPKESELYRFAAEGGYPDSGAAGLAGMFLMLDDYWTVADGMQSWADILAESFKEAGGTLKLSTYVDKIITRRGTAIGVSAGNETFPADYVLAAGDYKKTFLELLDDTSLIPQNIKSKIEKSPVSEGFFTVYLGLNLSNEKLKEKMQTQVVSLCNNRETADTHNPRDNRFFEKCFLDIYSPSQVNPRLAPEGKSSLMLQAICPPGWMNNWEARDREKYLKLKQEVMETLISRAEKIIPGLSESLDYKEAATPLTYERYTHNTDGASSSWCWNPKKSFYPPGTQIKVKSPVKNLLVSSCWATPIGGVPGALQAAYICASIINRK